MLKFKTPQVITAKYRITTPMFLGNAFQEVDERQFQTSSFRGALRFWWRALEWAHCVDEARGREAEALRLLHQREASLFGLAADKDESTQSRVMLQASITGARKQAKVQPLPVVLVNVTYLMGQGLVNQDGHLLREYISGGALDVHVQMRPVPGVKAEEQKSLEKTVANALTLLGLLGGLGSRARRGFGSLAIQSLKVDGGEELAPQSLEDAKKFLQSLKLDVPAEEVPLSALTRRSRVMVAANAHSPLMALAKVNGEMKDYRSSAKGEKVGQHQPVDRNFVVDHDFGRKAAHGEKPNVISNRSVFGLPHKDYPSLATGGKGKGIKETVRRSSPLLIHVHQFPGSDDACVIQTLLPAMFLPGDTPINPKHGPAQQVPFTAVDWQVIHTYMDRFINKHQGQNLLTPKA